MLIFCEISRFLNTWPVCLEMAYSRPFLEFWGYDGVPLGFGYQRKGSKTRVLGIPDGWKSFKIGLAVLSQHRRVTDTQPPSQPSFHSKYRATKRPAGKNAIKIRQNCVCPTLSWRSYGHFAFSNPIAASSVTFKIFFSTALKWIYFLLPQQVTLNKFQSIHGCGPPSTKILVTPQSIGLMKLEFGMYPQSMSTEWTHARTLRPWQSVRLDLWRLVLRGL